MTAKKKATKQEKKEKIRITYNPQFSAAESKTILLRTSKQTVIGESVRRDFIPTIDGLPMEFTIKKGEIKEVTYEQFKALYEMGHIDLLEDLEKRKKEIDKINSQVGVNPREYKMAKELAPLYDENFILVV